MATVSMKEVPEVGCSMPSPPCHGWQQPQAQGTGPSGRYAFWQKLLEDIIKAMRDNHVIFISYYSYNSEKYYEFDIHPYFVKAFKKRWYVVAYSPGTNDIRCYALDRMENVIISDKVFKMPKDLEPAEYFKDCFGIINNEDSEVQKVVLKVDAFQSNYIRNLPLHESQKEMKVPMNTHL